MHSSTPPWRDDDDSRDPAEPGPAGQPTSRSGSLLGDDEPLYVFTRDSIRELDRAAIEDIGIPGVILMENAAREVTEELVRLGTADPRLRRLLVCCGKGNNGGDGLAVARHAHNAGFEVDLLLAFDPRRGGRDRKRLAEEAHVNLGICEAMGIRTHVVDRADPEGWIARRGMEADLVVDALLGTGVRDAPRAPFDALIAWINDLGKPVVAIDIPSGLDADRGTPTGTQAIRADVTVSLVGLKQGYLELAAQPWLGEIVVGSIGVPVELCAEFGEPVDAEPYGRFAFDDEDEPHGRPGDDEDDVGSVWRHGS